VGSCGGFCKGCSVECCMGFCEGFREDGTDERAVKDYRSRRIK
jgi:hypothetical protein